MMTSTVFLACCLLMGTVCSLTTPSIAAPSAVDPVPVVCAFISKKKEIAPALMQSFKDTLSKNNFNKKYPLTTAYINNAQSQSMISSSVDSCKKFFDGLRVPLGEDAKKNGQSYQDAKDQFVQALSKPLEQFKPMFG